MKQNIASAALAVMPNCGHTINLEEPDEFNRLAGDGGVAAPVHLLVRDPSRVGHVSPTMQDIRSGSLILDLEECLPPSEQADDAEGGVVDWIRLNRRVAPANPKGYRSGSGRGLNLEGGRHRSDAGTSF